MPLGCAPPPMRSQPASIGAPGLAAPGLHPTCARNHRVGRALAAVGPAATAPQPSQEASDGGAAALPPEEAHHHAPCAETASHQAVSSDEAAVALAGPSSQPLPLPASAQGVVLDEGGWVVALAVVFAARLGRLTSQETRLDVRQLQREREQSRALSKELRLRREAWKLGEAARSAAEDAQRVAEAAARAKEEAKAQAIKQLRYKEEAEREAERLAAERSAARAQYNKEQARLDAEYQTRVQQEQQLLEEAREKARREDEARRTAEEERRRQVEAARQEREAAEQREREEAAQRRVQERRRLEGEKQRFAVRLDGSVAVMRPPKGTLLPGPLEQQASVRLQVRAGSLLGGPGDEVAADFGSVADAAEALPALVGQQAREACNAAASTMRLQAMTGQGPFSVMDAPELQHWMAVAAARTAVAGLAAGEAALRQFSATPKAPPQPAPFQLRTEYGVLPPDHPESTAAVLGRVISAIEGGASSGRVGEMLAEQMDADNEAVYSGLEPLPASLQASPRQLGAVLTLSHLLDRMLHDRPAKSSDAPAWFEGAAAVVRQQLAALTAGAAPDSLQAPAALMAAALGPTHPVALELTALAEANLSAGEVARRVERERARQSALAERLLAEEWPDEGDMRAARQADRDAKTPVPERVWALRNVAGTLALGSPGERARARKLLEQAVILKQRFAGDPDHPTVLPEMVALCDLLEGTREWAKDAKGMATIILRVMGSIGTAYAQSGDLLSAAIVLEAALRRYEEAAGVRSQTVRAFTRRADDALAALGPEERSIVAEQRPKFPAALARVVEALTEQLGAYKDRPGQSKVLEWKARGVGLIGSLRL